MDLRRRFPFLERLEAHADTFAQDVARVPDARWTEMKSSDAYVGSWRSFPLALAPRWAHEFPGLDLLANRAVCPDTAAALEGLPGLVIGGFLSLEPGSELRTHVDFRDDDVIRAHVALQLPPAEAARWPLGTARLLDIRQPHAARNDTSQPRLTLMVDVRMPFVIAAGEIPPWND